MSVERAAATERVAGADTREASASAVVRAAAAATALVAGPGWAAALGTPAAWDRYLSMPGGLAPWVALLLAVAGVGAAVAGWRVGESTRERVPGQLRLPRGLGPVLLLALVAFVAVGTRDAKLAASAMPAVPLAAGWFAGQATRRAVASCAANNESAASGLVVAGGLIGLVFAGHIALVADGSGLVRATGWTTVYLALAAINLVRADRASTAAESAAAEKARATALAVREPDPEADTPGRRAKKTEREPVFVLDDIHVSFGPNQVLRGATLRVAPGELVALVGGNGAGKSTLMRVAAGLALPEAGRVTVGRDDVTTLLVEERAGAGLAFVSGARPVFADLTVVENLRVAAFRSHLTPRAFNDATASIFEVIPALAKRRKARAGVLSGGEQRLLAVAQTLYRRPVVLLADELSLGLDAEARLAVLDLLRILADEDVAVVAVDHDLVSLLPRSDRAALLTGGVVTTKTHPERLLAQRSDLLPATFLAKAGR
jgi:branched-chain amino acid transport system ATP-binding protein